VVGKNDPGATGDLNIIALGTVIEGKITSQGSIRINGKTVGDIMVSGNLVVGATGDVNGNLEAKNVTIGGKVGGNIVAKEKLVFESKAMVTGDVRAAKIVIDEGAVFDGECVMDTAKASDKKPAPNIEGFEKAG
jgi:cytoskeletal protein CcmA (bactofilin family)